MDAGVIPSLASVVFDLGEGQRLDVAIEIRIEEKRKREPITAGRILYSMRSGQITSSSYPVQHIADVT